MDPQTSETVGSFDVAVSSRTAVEPEAVRESGARNETPADVVEAALADALGRAAAAAEWETVRVLAGELATRREYLALRSREASVESADIIALDDRRRG